jgi:hypothetical protein
MKPRRTHVSNQVFRLPGGNEDNDLWVALVAANEGGPAIVSTWELEEHERSAIYHGANIDLVVFGTAHPPVALEVSTATVGKAPVR